MEKTEIYHGLVQRKGFAYRDSQLELDYTHYLDPIDTTPGRLAGNSRIVGDASPEVQSRSIDALIKASQMAGLSKHDTAYVLAIARVESGFNPDAAAGTTSAFGLGQMVDSTALGLAITDANAGDVTKQAEALVQLYKENKALASLRGQSEEYIYKYHHDGPDKEYGGLAKSKASVMPYLERYEMFVESHEERYGRVSVDPDFYARNHVGTARPRQPAGHARPSAGVLRDGDRGEAVAEVQHQLKQLGYTGKDGKPIQEDGRYGPMTESAIREFQADRGLTVDGKVGRETSRALIDQVAHMTKPNALQCPARLDDPMHPDYAMFKQAQSHVFRLDQEAGRASDQASDNLASSLVVSARLHGLQSIDMVAFSDDADKLWAIERPSHLDWALLDKQAHVDTVSALQASMEQSGAQWPKAMQQFNDQQQVEQQTQQQAQIQTQQQVGPPGSR